MLIVVTEEGHKPRLVDAKSVKAAIKFVMPTIEGRKASASDVAQILSNGGAVEKVSE